jgi:hypothetical protein
MQASGVGDTQSIRIATSGVFEFDCGSATFELGDMVGGVENTSGNALLDQTVAKVAAANLAIGRCARRVPVADTRVLVEIASTVMRGGVQTAA